MTLVPLLSTQVLQSDRVDHPVLQGHFAMCLTFWMMALGATLLWLWLLAGV
jgi:hypothetical protein